jgi:hypothetical protein
VRAWIKEREREVRFAELPVADLPSSELLRRIRAGVIRVGDGRGFIIEADKQRLVLTAAHCLPRYPTPNGGWDHTYINLLGPLGCKRPKVWAECVFVDPVADLAVLGSPDNQDLYEQAEADAYDALVNAMEPFSIGGTDTPETAYLLGLDPNTVVMAKTEVVGIVLWVTTKNGYFEGGMSGSPVVMADGNAISLVSTSSGTGDRNQHIESGPSPLLSACLPAWLVRR